MYAHTCICIVHEKPARSRGSICECSWPRKNPISHIYIYYMVVVVVVVVAVADCTFSLARFSQRIHSESIRTFSSYCGPCVCVGGYRCQIFNQKCFWYCPFHAPVTRAQFNQALLRIFGILQRFDVAGPTGINGQSQPQECQHQTKKPAVFGPYCHKFYVCRVASLFV